MLEGQKWNQSLRTANRVLWTVVGAESKTKHDKQNFCCCWMQDECHSGVNPGQTIHCISETKEEPEFAESKFVRHWLTPKLNLELLEMNGHQPSHQKTQMWSSQHTASKVHVESLHNNTVVSCGCVLICPLLANHCWSPVFPGCPAKKYEIWKVVFILVELETHHLTWIECDLISFERIETQSWLWMCAWVWKGETLHRKRLTSTGKLHWTSWILVQQRGMLSSVVRVRGWSSWQTGLAFKWQQFSRTGPFS